MGTFSFESGYQPTPTNKGKRAGQRNSKARVFSAPCECYDVGLTCFHTVQEKSASLHDSTIERDDTPADWIAFFETPRAQNTQRYNAGKV